MTILIAELLLTEARRLDASAESHVSDVRLWEADLTDETPDPVFNARWLGIAEADREHAKRLRSIACVITEGEPE